jgi:hypothetical protein
MWRRGVQVHRVEAAADLDASTALLLVWRRRLDQHRGNGAGAPDIVRGFFLNALTEFFDSL